jgi:phosphonoacetaldehyde hydrolase
MGLPKRDHLLTLLHMPAVADRWRQAHHRDGTEADLARLYDCYVRHQLDMLEPYSQLIPGVLGCVAHLRQMSIRIGATTGYFREAAARVQRAAAGQGFVPEYSVCVEDVPAGRPAPWMIYRIMEALKVYPPKVVVKVGDTTSDIEEGLHAGAWSIGVTRSSSEVGHSEEALSQLPASQKQELLTRARQTLSSAGAHAVIETLGELPSQIEDLNIRLGRGEKP